jgi:hypothetical protein
MKVHHSIASQVRFVTVLFALVPFRSFRWARRRASREIFRYVFEGTGVTLDP